MAITQEVLSGSADHIIANVQMIGGICLDNQGGFQNFPAVSTKTGTSPTILRGEMSGSRTIIEALNKLASEVDSGNDPAGSDTQIQWNNDGSFGADAAFTYDNDTAPTFTLGDATAEDVKMVFDGNAKDYYIALDDSADDLIIGLGSAVGTTPIISMDEDQKVTIEKDLEVKGDTSTFTSANTTDPLVVIKNTTNDANGGRLRFVKDKGAAGADDDVAGLIEFYADDDNQDQVLFAKIEAAVADASNGSEGGKLSLGVASHDGEFQNGLVLADGSAEDEIDVTIGNGAASVTTVAGVMKVTGNIIQASDGGSTITMDTSDNVTIAGDLTVSGGDIKGSGGTAITIDASNNVAVAGDLTVTGNDINASDGTATITMSSRDVTVAGDLTVSGNDIDFSAAAATLGASVGANVITYGGATSRHRFVSSDAGVSTGVEFGLLASDTAMSFKRGSDEAQFLGSVTGSLMPGQVTAKKAAMAISASLNAVQASAGSTLTATGVLVGTNAFANKVPFLSIQGADASGVIKDYKLQISGGILQVNEYQKLGNVY